MSSPLPARLLALVASFLVTTTVGFAQGALTPPGAPAPTMKSLSDLDAKLTTLTTKSDPRVAITQATLDSAPAGYILLNTPGSYYLASNITISPTGGWGIWISVPDVTLDLNGYTISAAGSTVPLSFGVIYIGTPGTDIGIANVTVRNGTLLGPKVRTTGANPWQATYSAGGGFSRGLFCQRSGASWGSNHFRIEGLTVRGFSNGIDLNVSGLEYAGGRASLSRCQVLDCEGTGINGQFLELTDVVVSGCNGTAIRTDVSTLERVVIERCGGDGVNGGSNVIRSTAVRFVGGTGFNLGANSRGIDLSVGGAARGVNGSLVSLQGITAQNNRGHGIELYNSQLTGFMTSGNTGSGVNGNNNTITEGTSQANTSHGIVSGESSVRNLTAFSNTGAGIYCDNSTITGCIARLNGDDGIRGINSVISDCRAANNDTTAGGYTAVGIAWSGGKIANSLADTASPAIP